MTANAFVRDGYHFDGWATASDGNVVYNDGQSVSNLTAEDGGTVNLFAHWTKSELTNIALTPTDYAVQEEHPTITATPTLSISSGIGTTSICWGLYTDAGCTTPVDGVSFSPDPSAGAGAVTFTAPDDAGTYYLKAIFRAGSTCEGTELNSFSKSFIVHPTHTTTVKAKVGEEFIPNAEYDQTSHTVTVNTHRATEVAAPVIPGYTFVNWTLGSNI
ncbi:MAG: InlB B-repeat-containing protein, partial [Paludibacteraceae bacterium]|nr:InlB B-repeat-containing protein [Paludibacteraceae bacterium]